MGKALKFLLPIGAFAIAGPAGAALFGTAAGAASVAGPGLAFFGSMPAAASAGALATSGLIGSGGLAASAGSFFSSTSGFSNIFKGFSILSDIAGGIAANKQAQLAIQQEKHRARLARLQALQLEARVVQAGARARGAAIAQAASQGRTLTGRDFLAFMDDQEDQVKEEVGTIRVNASSADRVSSLIIRQFGVQGRSALAGGIFDAGRSLFSLAEEGRVG